MHKNKHHQHNQVYSPHNPSPQPMPREVYCQYIILLPVKYPIILSIKIFIHKYNKYYVAFLKHIYSRHKKRATYMAALILFNCH